MEVYEHNGSGWVFSNFASLQLTLWHLDPLRASAFVPLPKWIRDKRAVTNIIGTGDDCFKWAVLAGLHPTTSDRPNRIENYMTRACKYNLSTLSFPVPLSSIASFGVKNNIFINVYGVEDGQKVIYSLRVTDVVVPERHVDLLLHELGEIQHYSMIKNFNRLVSGQLSRHNCATYCCKKCLHAYSSPELLEAHSLDCCHVQRTKFPKYPRCQFTNIQKQLLAPFVVYADLESILRPIIEDVDATQGFETGVGSSTTVYQEHIPCSFVYKIVISVDPDFSRPLVMYRGEDAAEWFLRDLQRDAGELCAEYIETPNPMEFTVEDELSYTNATECHICSKPLGEDRVRDHCHITGIYRGDAHSICNLNYREIQKVGNFPWLFII